MQELAGAFLGDERIKSVAPLGNGHINGTFLVETETNRYVLQRINTHVFKDPVGLMKNVGAVSAWLEAASDYPLVSLHFLSSKEKNYHRDQNGDFWRMYEFLEGFCPQPPVKASVLTEGARAFGLFQQALSDFPAETLKETIPDFHNTPHRFQQLKEAIEMDPLGRAEKVKEEIEFLLSHEEEAGELRRLQEKKLLPLRVTHNDTKINNILLHQETGKALCVLDLDTVMPGLSLYDFGDGVRSGAALADEDKEEEMGLSLSLYEIYARQFTAAFPALTKEEKELLPQGVLTITLECASRFIADYLLGDTYFSPAYPEHNRIRGRAQIRLAKDILMKKDQMQRVLK